MEQENITKEIPGYPGYFATSNGTIRRNGRTLAVKTDKYGYLVLSMVDSEGKVRGSRMVHRCIASAFHGIPDRGKECSHINGCKTDNRPQNLAWVTRKENHLQKILHGTSKHGPIKILSVEQFLVIKAAALSGLSKRTIAAAFGISMSVVSGIRTGRIGNKNRKSSIIKEPTP